MITMVCLHYRICPNNSKTTTKQHAAKNNTQTGRHYTLVHSQQFLSTTVQYMNKLPIVIVNNMMGNRTMSEQSNHSNLCCRCSLLTCPALLHENLLLQHQEKDTSITGIPFWGFIQ